jgi:type II secretory pathway pseudopilin PulG
MSSTDRRRGGFTLAELLIATVLAGLFAIVLFNFINSQSRFTRAQGARQEANQNLRGALEIIGSELRAVPGGAISVAGTQNLTFVLPRVWGIYCGAGGGRSHVVFPAGSADASRTDAFPADFAAPGFGLAIESPAAPGQFLMSGITEYVALTDADAQTTCGPMGTVLTATAGTPAPVGYGFTTGALGAVPASGADAFVYSTVTYDVVSSTGGISTPTSGRWLRRSTAHDGSAMSPLAGPLNASGTPFQLTYYCNGTAFNPADAAGRAKITEVRVIMSTQSRSSTNSVLQTETDTLTVHLRNSGMVTVC